MLAGLLVASTVIWTAEYLDHCSVEKKDQQWDGLKVEKMDSNWVESLVVP
jgi:hypothetical protein